MCACPLFINQNIWNDFMEYLYYNYSQSLMNERLGTLYFGNLLKINGLIFFLLNGVLNSKSFIQLVHLIIHLITLLLLFHTTSLTLHC